jgi:hypothetical protein
MPISSYERIGRSLIHELPGALQLCASEVWAVLQKAADPFFMDIGGPLCAEHTHQREVHQKIAQLRWVEHVCIIENDKRHASDPDLLVIGHELSKGRSALGVGSALVRHQGFKANAAMGADLPVLDLAFIQKLDEERP